MRKQVLALAMSLMMGVVLGAQQATMPTHAGPAAKGAKTSTSTAAKIKRALSSGPSDVTKNAAVVEPTEGGTMKQLRAGTNGWVCMAEPEAMCLDKAWQNWVEAWMAKKDPQIKSVGIGYMLLGDKGASNTDPFATGPTADNHWVVSPAHVMVLTPDSRQLDGLPTEPNNGGPWVMWKGTPYAHIMVPTAPMKASMTTKKQ